MSKPVFTIGFPMDADIQSVERARKNLTLTLGEDYHVLTYRAKELTGMTFGVLNAINATDVEITDLIDKTRITIESIINEKNNSQ